MKCSWGLVDTRGGGQEKIFYKLRIICWWSEGLGWAEWVDQVTTTRLEIASDWKYPLQQYCRYKMIQFGRVEMLNLTNFVKFDYSINGHISIKRVSKND